MNSSNTPKPTLTQLTENIRQWSQDLEFQQIGFTRTDLSQAGERLQGWLDNDYHGSMQWLAEHGDKRWHPEKLLPGTVSVICVRMDYLPADSNMVACLKDGEKAYLSRYALGRDYHKLMRKRLATLASKIEAACGEAVIQRPFVDSAPVMEKPLAEQAGLGWIGKNTLLLNRQAGSWFFLGELYTSLALPEDKPMPEKQCGQCRACHKVCPTDAFPEPYVLDARRCISYLTIENKGPIPVEFRKAMGNRVFGCDDCQIICPWNRFASATTEQDFQPRHKLDNSALVTLFGWSEEQFLSNTAGSPIRRIGYERWQRNLAVGLGNAPYSTQLVRALQTKLDSASELIKEHIIWALEQQSKNAPDSDGSIDINSHVL
ncbi:MAG: tRNA epoxyqueuosine(34) reductase QueG [Porticoccaceae bacterium]|nr:tRNA epoxyqueuosine(34) reductase QueG [Porticoccaceae bacterium]